jgi:hypothetical protein
MSGTDRYQEAFFGSLDIHFSLHIFVDLLTNFRFSGQGMDGFAIMTRWHRTSPI